MHCPKRCSVPAACRDPECWPSVTAGPSCPPTAMAADASPYPHPGSPGGSVPPPCTPGMVALLGRIPEAVASLQAPPPSPPLPPTPPRVPHPSGGSESLSNPHPTAACGAAGTAALPAAGTRVHARACSLLPSCILHQGGCIFHRSCLHFAPRRGQLRFPPGMFPFCTGGRLHLAPEVFPFCTGGGGCIFYLGCLLFAPVVLSILHWG